MKWYALLVFLFILLLFTQSEAILQEDDSTHFLVVISNNTGRIRWVATADTDKELATLLFNKHEQAIMLPIDDLSLPLPELQDLISSMTGLIPVNDTFAVLYENKTVRGIIIADPFIDTLPSSMYVRSTQASIGDAYDVFTGTFIKPISTPTPLPNTNESVVVIP